MTIDTYMRNIGFKPKKILFQTLKRMYLKP
jgi:hypothetical protein